MIVYLILYVPCLIQGNNEKDNNQRSTPDDAPDADGSNKNGEHERVGRDDQTENNKGNGEGWSDTNPIEGNGWQGGNGNGGF